MFDQVVLKQEIDLQISKMSEVKKRPENHNFYSLSSISTCIRDHFLISRRAYKGACLKHVIFGGAKTENHEIKISKIFWEKIQFVWSKIQKKIN